MGLRSIWGSFRRKDKQSRGQYQDVHNRLMAKYEDAPEWWYLVLLLVAIGFGVGAIAGWQTYTTPGVVFYGLLLCAIFVVPVGIVKATTGIEVCNNWQLGGQEGG
jgi:hypothetical protein